MNALSSCYNCREIIFDKIISERGIYYMIKARIIALIDAIKRSKESNKNLELEYVENFIKDCGAYIEKVNAMEAALTSARFRLEPDDYRELIVQLDRSRKYAHDALIASVRLINRLCGVYDVPQVYKGPDERILIADFALEVTTEFYKERKL